MPKRQIIIFALTGLAVLYGAFSSFVQPLLNDPRNLVTLNRAEIQASIDNIRSELDKARPTPLELYRLELALGEMPDNPFYTSSDQMEEAPKEQTSTEGPTFTYGGYVEMGGTRLAILNGLDYMPGEELSEAGYFVTRIERNKVVIEKRGEDMKVLERINVPLTDDFAIVSEEKDAKAPDEQ